LEALGKYIDDVLDGRPLHHVCGKGVEDCNYVNKNATVFHVSALRKLRSDKLPAYVFEGLDAPPEASGKKPQERMASDILEDKESEEEKISEELRGVRSAAGLRRRPCASKPTSRSRRGRPWFEGRNRGAKALWRLPTANQPWRPWRMRRRSSTRVAET
jgi:hypothetical protein